MAIALKAFTGIRPILEPRLLQEGEAQIANNVKLNSGRIAPLLGTTTLKALTLNNPQTIYRYGTSNTETNHWLEFAGDVDVVRSPVIEDAYDRLYWTDGTLPRYAPNNLITTGATYPGNSYQLGVPKPSTAITYTSYTAPATFTVVTRDYIIFSHNPSTLAETTASRTVPVQAVDGEEVVLSKMPVSTVSGFTKLKIYRKLSGTFRLVATIDQTQTTYTDTTTDATLTSGQVAPAITSSTASFVAEGKIPTKVVPESRTYVYTYVTAYGEEGPPSDASAVVDVDPAYAVTLSVPTGSPNGAYNITSKRIYRSSTVGSRAQFQFVAEVALATGSYVDTKEQADLGEVLPSEDWIAPPATLKGLKVMANGVGVGFSGRTLYLSEPYLLHAWPHKYPVRDEIVGLGTFGQTVVVLTKGRPEMFTGIDPAAMSNIPMSLAQSCSSKTSIVDMGDGVIFASPDGLVSVGQSGIDIISKQFFNREQWQAINPSSIKAYLYNGKYICFYTDTSNVRGGLIFDISGQGAPLLTTDIHATTAVTAGFYDATTDTLYFARGGNIVRFDRGSALTYTWRSKVYRLPFQNNFAAAIVRADAYPVTFKIYADGALKHTQTVANGEIFRLPSGFRGLDWEVEVTGTSQVTEVAVAKSSMELMQL